jgi:hypothetical protein
MIHIDYDNESSEEQKEETTTSTVIPTVSTTVSTTVSSTIPTTSVTSVVSTNANYESSDENVDDDCSWNTEIAEARAPLGKFRELLIPDRPNDNSERSRKDWLKDIKYCLQHRYVYCHQCKQWVTKAQYKSRNIQGVGCHWKKKCPLCQQMRYNKRVDKGLCHVIFNGQVVIPNEPMRWG